MNIKIKDKVTVEYPGGMRLGGVVMGIIQVQGKDPVYEVVFEQLYGTHGQFPLNQVVSHVSV